MDRVDGREEGRDSDRPLSSVQVGRIILTVWGLRLQKRERAGGGMITHVYTCEVFGM